MTTPVGGNTLAVRDLFNRLMSHYGVQNWWPAEHSFEMAVGAVLVQNTAWGNAAKAIASLRAHGLLAARSIVESGADRVAPVIRSSGTYRVKAVRLEALAKWWLNNVERAGSMSAAICRSLRGVHGIGPETADCIALYAFNEPVFIADAYARRLLSRMGVLDADVSYQRAQAIVQAQLPADADYLGEAHAVVVAHGKALCRRRPCCARCLLLPVCPAGRESTAAERVVGRP